MKKKKIIFVVPDGTGIRNYLFSELISYLLKSNTELLIYHVLSKDAITEVEQLHNIKLTTKQLPKYSETLQQKFLRESICYARLLFYVKLEDNPTLLATWKKTHTGKKKWFYKLVEFYGIIKHKSYSKILKLEEKYQKSIETSIVNELEFLKQYKPDAIFCTHQRAINAVPVFKAAEVLGIKTIGAIYSWDNLPKARLAIKTSKYLVWSEHMKNEFKKYYPEISQDNVIITGTPQFSLYENANILERVTFFKHNNLDTNRFTICFSGDDVRTSPNDPNYLEHLAQSINSSDYKDKVQIVFRRSPVDVSGRYDEIVNKYEHLIIPIEPVWSNTKKQWTQIYPIYDDVNLLANICKHCDLVINLGSTMAHDFTYFNNASAYLNYDVKPAENWSVKTIYKYQHFRSMPHKDVVYWINSKEDFIPLIEKVMQDNSSKGKEWFKVINDSSINSSEEISKLLIE
ncbi:MAG: hypothetical protein HRU50_05600 [Winogradskyella sp.]|uniref:hypothetical protein n=1 Tax=Winogradskyella sp. TaxID=1883156 RepID=UPI0025F20D67|nr:hypothetical protein [Winogradskyella sp.]NRB59405.1 hypothetical protein [Winogradskyella sp.]